jgi:hypothetical protein
LPHRAAAGRPAIRARGINRSVDPDRHFRTARTVRTGPASVHTMWMPRSCTWNDMNAASTPYDPVLVGWV